ncbi:MAG: type IV secretion protein Rhs [Weeksellaceae bacterium]|nr:type IV secretion protein Rhs [Weeksellaceae bacterium]
MKKIYFIIAVFIANNLFSQSNFQDTKGNVEVNTGGQLQYTLPIELPKGIKDISPNISLLYTSNSGNGIAGYGWSLSGITAISRVGKTIEKDGELRGVKLDYSDFFSYNGQKLILKTGTYGQDGAEYVTQKYSNIKIKSVGSIGFGNLPQTYSCYGPEHFEVTFEDGSQAWYGKYVARAVDNATTPIEYNIVKWKDAQGNIINYNYEQANNVAIIKSITWGGNETLNRPNYNEILFTYSSRDLSELSHVYGASFLQNQLLKEITVKTNGNQFRKYLIDNTFKNGTNYNFVKSITEYNANNEPANPVIFDYPQIVSGSVDPDYLQSPDPFNGVKLTGDFNGDSYIDFVMSGSVKLGAFNDNFSTVTTNKTFNSDALVVNTLIDTDGSVYNGNGIVQLEGNNVAGYLFKNNSFQKIYEKQVFENPCSEYSLPDRCILSKKFYEGDFDGDGISNVFVEVSANVTVFYPCPEPVGNLNPPPGDCSDTYTIDVGNFIVDLKDVNLPISTYTKDPGINYSNTSTEKYMDVDGDGKVEPINVSNDAYTVFEFLKIGTNQYQKKIRFTKNLVETKQNEFPVLFGDFNGDGKLDFTIPTADASMNWRFYIGNGNGFNNFLKGDFTYYHNRVTESSNGYNKNTYQYFYSVCDINKDGKSDVVTVYSYNRLNLQNYDWRLYGYNISTKISSGTLTDGTLSFNSDVSYQSPSYNLHDYLDLTLFTPLTNPIKANNNYYNIYLYWKEHLHRLKAPTSLAELARIKSISQPGLNTFIEYSELNPDVNSNFYNKSKQEYYPYFSLQRADQTFVVTQLTQNSRKQDFRYRGMTVHFQGRGILGFHQLARSSWYANGYENTKVWSGTEIDPQKYGVPSKEWSIKTNDESQIFPLDLSLGNQQLLTFKQTTYSIDQLANGVEVILPQSIKQKDFLKDITTEQNIYYGDYYLPSGTETFVNGSFSIMGTGLTYTHNPTGIGSDYYIGRPLTKQSSNFMSGYGLALAKEEYTFENNLLKTLKSWNRDNSDYLLQTFTYDGWGNVTQKLSSNSIDSQTETGADLYDSTGRFILKKTDKLGLETNFTYDAFGHVLTQTDVFNNMTTNTYDNWGKLLTSSGLNGLTTYIYGRDSNNGFVVTQIHPDGNISRRFSDILGQEYKVHTKTFEQNKYVATYTLYDLIGRKIKESEPYFDSAAEEFPAGVKWNEISYDDSVYPPTVTTQSFNNGKKTLTTISGNTVSLQELNGYGRTTSKTTDAFGNVVSSTDAGGTITFSYNAYGQVTKATYGENIVTTVYDPWGRKSQFSDPANGTYSYEYTGLGSIKKETSPKGYKQYTYKSNGLLDTVIEKSNDNTSTDKNYSYTYDQNWQLTAKTGTANGKSFSTQFAYYQNGRMGWTTDFLEGRQFYKWDIAYDTFGNIKTYRMGIISNGVTTETKLENFYNSWDGSLKQVKEQNTGKLLWELQNVNEKGQVLSAKLGNTQVTNAYDSFGFLDTAKHISSNANLMDMKYVFNAIKNELLERHHYNFNIDEYFTYNNNRLTDWTNPKTGQLSSNTYDDKGRITVNDQLGSITFGLTGNIYRASKMNLNTIGLSNYGIGGTNILLQNISYNENNDPVKIRGRQNDYAFEYGLSENRQIMSYGSKFEDSQNAQFTKYYNLDGSMEVIRNNITGQEKHLIYIGGTPYESNIVYLKNFSESNGSYKFLHKDYLGSVLAISDEAGNAVERRHFDAWGVFTHLKFGNDATITDANTIRSANLLVDRGYTSHEHLLGVDLIHMNGRLYDPLLRRFLNADENIQDPYNTQIYNKYGYVLNNPLMFNDPSGEFVWAAFVAYLSQAVFSAVLASAVIYTAVGIIKGDWSINGFFRTMSFAAVTAMATAGISSIFNVSGFLSQVAIGSLVGGVGGGVQAVLTGENFFNGALRGAAIGGLTAALGYVGNQTISTAPNASSTTDLVKVTSQAFGARALRILSSFIAYDSDKTLLGKSLQILSHFTWELPQQLFSVIVAEFSNLSGAINSVDRYTNGAIILRSNWLSSGNAFTVGNMLTLPNLFDLEDLQHEFGHYIQSRIFGPAWLPLFGLPSILNASFGGLFKDWGNNFTLVKYENSLYTEWSAGRWGRKYW